MADKANGHFSMEDDIVDIDDRTVFGVLVRSAAGEYGENLRFKLSFSIIRYFFPINTINRRNSFFSFLYFLPGSFDGVEGKVYCPSTRSKVG